LILVESKALKQAHSKLSNCFSNAAIGKNRPPENRNRGRAKYNGRVYKILFRFFCCYPLLNSTNYLLSCLDYFHVRDDNHQG